MSSVRLESILSSEAKIWTFVGLRLCIESGMLRGLQKGTSRKFCGWLGGLGDNTVSQSPKSFKREEKKSLTFWSPV